MEGGDLNDLLSQALVEAEIKFQQEEDDFQKSNMTQRNYIAETEPITDDSDSDGLSHILEIVKEKDVTDSQLKAIEYAVDLSGMLSPGGACEVGARKIRMKQELNMVTTIHTEDYPDIPASGTSKTDSKLNAVEHAVDNFSMLSPGGDCEAGAKKIPWQQGEETRFIHVSDDLVAERGKPYVPPNTLKKNKWSLNVFTKWRREFLTDASNATGQCGEAYTILSDVSRELHQMTALEISIVLCVFVIALKKENGEHYPGESVLSIMCGLQRYLRLHDRQIDFFNDTVFSRLKMTIDNTMQDRCMRGIGIQRRQAAVLTQENEEILWKKGLLGVSTPQALVDTIFWTVGINFGLRGGEEHRRFIFRNFEFKTDSDGQRYLEYTESVSKTCRGGLKHRNTEPHSARAYKMDNPNKCPVKLFELYKQRLPEERDVDTFYFRPLIKPKGETRFSKQVIGHNKLDTIVRRLMLDANIQGFFTNNSLRASTTTRLYNAGVDEQIIKEQTGHRSLAIETYKRTSDGQKRQVSHILQGKMADPSETKRLKSEDSLSPSADNSPDEPGSNITINKYW